MRGNNHIPLYDSRGALDKIELLGIRHFRSKKPQVECGHDLADSSAWRQALGRARLKALLWREWNDHLDSEEDPFPDIAAVDRGFIDVTDATERDEGRKRDGFNDDVDDISVKGHICARKKDASDAYCGMGSPVSESKGTNPARFCFLTSAS